MHLSNNKQKTPKHVKPIIIQVKILYSYYTPTNHQVILYTINNKRSIEVYLFLRFYN